MNDFFVILCKRPGCSAEMKINSFDSASTLVRFFDNDVWKVMSSLNQGFEGISCTFTSRTLLEVNSVIICNVEVSAGSKSFIKDAVC